MLHQGEAGGSRGYPLHLFSNGAQIFVSISHSDLELHAQQGMDGNLSSLGFNQQQYNWQQTQQLLSLKQEDICYGKSQTALSYFSMSIITKENLKTIEDQHLYVLAEHPPIKLLSISIS